MLSAGTVSSSCGLGNDSASERVTWHCRYSFARQKGLVCISEQKRGRAARELEEMVKERHIFPFVLFAVVSYTRSDWGIVAIDSPRPEAGSRVGRIWWDVETSCGSLSNGAEAR